jgi:phosphoglycerol transferase MdoB-like AlkP superfamily enzyme
MYIGWMDSTTHTPFLLPPTWKNNKTYFHDDGIWASLNGWLNAVRWTDDIVKDIILGFRERGLEDETLFIMYSPPRSINHSHGDHAFPFVGDWLTPIDNPHNEHYRIPMMIYNPRIKNPLKKVINGNFYSLSIPTTILDLMVHTKSFSQSAQQTLAQRFAANYEHAQSLLRPIKPVIRLFSVAPGGGQWVLDNGSNLRVPSQFSELN